MVMMEIVIALRKQFQEIALEQGKTDGSFLSNSLEVDFAI
jgi:hypothetical protein